MILVAGWATDGPLGHDEAAYAIGGQALLAGEASPWLYRSVGMHPVAAVGVAAGGSEWALRAPAVLLAVGFLFAVRVAGRRLLGGETSAWAAAVLVGVHGVALRGHELLSDLPSTACLLIGAAILASELERAGGARWRIAAAAPWLAAAFYLRYGSAVPIAVIGTAALVVWPRVVVARPLPVLAAAGLFALLMVPHLAHAVAETGSPTGILTYSAGVPRRAYVGEGLVDYVTLNPFLAYGALAPPVLLAGLVSIVAPPGGAARPARYLWLLALGQVVVLGLISHATPRYVYFALTLLVLLGVDALVRLARRVGDHRRAMLGRVALALVATSWLGVLTATVVRAYRDDWRAPVVAAARAVRADARGRPCHVVSRRFAQLMWYARCPSGDMTPPAAKLDAGGLVYQVWIARSAATPELDAFVRATPTPLAFVEVAHDPGRYRVTRVSRATGPGDVRSSR